MSDLSNRLQELVEIIKRLNHDELICQENAKLKDKERAQFWRRMCYRSFFATVEGSSHCMKKVALNASKQFNLGAFDGDQIRKLKGEERLSLKDNVKFSLRSLAKSFDGSVDIDFTDSEWQAFIRAIEKRDELTHPKSPDGITVDESELDDLVDASAWFKKRVCELREEVLTQLGIQ